MARGRVLGRGVVGRMGLHLQLLLEEGFRLWGNLWRRSGFELIGRLLGELTRSNSEMERASWIARNYGNALAVSKRMFNRLLKVF
ncbi:hypothetical protein CRYUN_Cryun37aG0089600 [Craigia yunnanensis]